MKHFKSGRSICRHFAVEGQHRSEAMLPINIVLILMVLSLYQIKSEKEDTDGSRSFNHFSNMKIIKSLIIDNLEGKIKLRDTSRQRRTTASSCSSSCETKTMPVCYCDSLCPLLNDCCLGYSKTADTLSTRQNQNEISCELPIPIYVPPNSLLPFGIYMVKTCLMKYQDSMLAEKCSKSNSSDLLQIVPVTNKIGLSFSNIFCAICNDVLDFSFWDIGLYLPGFPEIKDSFEIFQNIAKNIIIPVPTHPVKPRICIRSSSVSNNIGLSDLCYKYQQPVIFSSQVFRNIHCIHKDRIDECSNLPPERQHKCRTICVDGTGVDFHEYIFNLKTNKNSLIIKFGENVHIEYDSERCRPEEHLNSKVKCVRLGCTDKMKDECNKFKIYYTYFIVHFLWRYLAGKSSKDISEDMPLQRYIHFILYVLSFNGIKLTRPYMRVIFCHDNTCDVRIIAAAFAYTDVIPIEEAEKLQSWVSTLQLSYTETNVAKVQTPLYHRVFEDGKNNSSQFSLHSSEYNRITRVSMIRDIYVYFQALARYHTPFLSFTHRCRHIHLSLLLNESANNIDRYKPTEFYCVNASMDNRPKALSVLLLPWFCFITIL